MPDINPILNLLDKHNFFYKLFDVVRLVDAQEGKQLEYTADGIIVETAIHCTDVFNSSERCKNCTSVRALYAGKTMIKLEYVGGAVLLIFSVPLQHEGRNIVIEMVKNISDSMTVDVKDQYRLDEVNNIINNLNMIASTDALTALYNRRYIDEHLPVFLENSLQNEQTLCGAIIDIDDFKKVNDAYGHQIGDQVLALVAQAISSFIRRSADWAARYGGEEFFVCFAGIELDDFLTVLERLRIEIARNKLLLDQGSPDNYIQVTVSIGASILKPHDNAQSFIERCDRLLYEAKQSGKNCVRVQ